MPSGPFSLSSYLKLFKSGVFLFCLPSDDNKPSLIFYKTLLVLFSMEDITINLVSASDANPIYEFMQNHFRIQEPITHSLSKMTKVIIPVF